MVKDDTIYAQVLLLDGKIENWKICQDRKNSPLDFKAYWKPDRIKDYTMETMVFKESEVDIPKDWSSQEYAFNWYVYKVLAPRWINRWNYSDDYRLGKCEEQTLEETIREYTL